MSWLHLWYNLTLIQAAMDEDIQNLLLWKIYPYPSHNITTGLSILGVTSWLKYNGVPYLSVLYAVPSYHVGRYFRIELMSFDPVKICDMNINLEGMWTWKRILLWWWWWWWGWRRRWRWWWLYLNVLFACKKCVLMRQWNRPLLVQMAVCRLIGNKPSSQILLDHC